MATREASPQPVFDFKATPSACRALKAVESEDVATVQVLLASGVILHLPEELAAVIRTAVLEAAEGHDLSLMSREDEVSPGRAGELLGLSRQYVDRLIAQGVLPARRLPDSTHRKIRRSDVLALAAQRDSRRELISDMVDTMTDAGAEY
ncbi:MAG: helix-turn-helix domain-containing protein [bacterium]|nr:helix-turn-helix domain-containing protein [bacterium]